MWRIWAILNGALVIALVAGGCRSSRQVRDSDYPAVVSANNQAASSPAPAIAALPPVGPSLAGPQPVEVYIQYAFLQNPDIESARKRVDALASRVPQAASLDDPMLSAMGFPFYPVVPQTAAGRSTVRMSVSQQVPWYGKLQTKVEAAEAEVNAARAQLAAAELSVVEQVKRTYYDLYFIQKAIRITQQDRQLLLDLSRIAESRYKTGKVSQQDVLRAQVEVFNLDNELIRLRQQFVSAQARLAQLLHVSPDTPVQALEDLPHEEAPRDLERLYQVAISVRPELQAQLAMIQRDHRQVELARLAYFPDFNFSVDWADMTTAGAMAPTADGIDDVGVGMMVNVPVYRKRLAAGVREAEAQAVADTRQFDSLRDQTVQEVKDLYVQAASQQDLLKLFQNDIIPKADQTLRVSMSAYQAGQVDFLQLVDNWRQLLRFRIAYYRLESQLRQTLASMERIVGGELIERGETMRSPLAPQPLPEIPLPPEATSSGPALPARPQPS